MVTKLRIVGAGLALAGLGFLGAAGFAYSEVAAGQDSLQSFSEAQGVELSYNEDGQLVDRGSVEGAEAILDRLENEWGYKVVESELDPNDPLVNTGTEYMYQMATVGTHILTGTQTVTVTETTEYLGETYEPGTYEVPVGEQYWADFEYGNEIAMQVRAQAWTGVAHGLFGELGVGSVTASTLKLGLGIVGLIGGLGLLFLALGVAAFWIAGDVAKRDAARAAVKVDDRELAIV
ncbi:hypothetical protein QQX09_10945 [Demequina sp. SYSU T00192]|uniref:Uncharacterized protein n=1 Tax=Demequina litoralis TaxID=3051660 RepID=A0ABT8GB53_9MICO|nr:hypothetical protein [Demequina sp. SYSU T00192]MDN4476372.1 hypothetical protein [Demequina sp. SYSU T00192]